MAQYFTLKEISRVPSMCAHDALSKETFCNIKKLAFFYQIKNAIVFFSLEKNQNAHWLKDLDATQ